MRILGDIYVLAGVVLLVFQGIAIFQFHQCSPIRVLMVIALISVGVLLDRAGRRKAAARVASHG